MKRTHIAVVIIFLVLLIDQVFKFWIKTNFYYGEEVNVIGDWFKLNFVENEGMAFGLAYGGKTGKLLLTLFRIIAVSFIGYFLYSLIKKDAPKGLILSMSLILAGALGNIVDSVFYGILFSASEWSHSREIAEFLPKEGGYAPLFYGKVVDMLYFPIISGEWPDWIPWIGGDRFLFFRPVFNIADSAITIGVIAILLFQKRFFTNNEMADEQEQVEISEDQPHDGSSQAIITEDPDRKDV